MSKQDMASYWLDTAEMDYQTMKRLYASRDFHWSLFIAHLVIEKLLKALIAKHRDRVAIPRSHDLLLLAEKAGLATDSRQKDLLDLITTFNMPLDIRTTSFHSTASAPLNMLPHAYRKSRS